MKKRDKRLKILFSLLIVIIVLLIITIYVFYKPKILGSPSQEVIDENTNYLVIFISVLSLMFVLLIGMITMRYAKIKSEESEKKQLIQVTGKTRKLL